MATLHPGNDLGNDLKRDVLRNNGNATATSHSFGHTATSNCGHIGDDNRNRGSGTVVGGQVNVESRRDIGSGRNHEHVIKREVGLWGSVVKEVHVGKG